MKDGDGAKLKGRVETLVRRLEPRIIDLFRRHGVEPDAAGEILEEVVTLLLYRWEDLTKPEAWLMEMLDRRARREGRDSPEGSGGAPQVEGK